MMTAMPEVYYMPQIDPNDSAALIGYSRCKKGLHPFDWTRALAGNLIDITGAPHRLAHCPICEGRVKKTSPPGKDTRSLCERIFAGRCKIAPAPPAPPASSSKPGSTPAQPSNVIDPVHILVLKAFSESDTEATRSSLDSSPTNS